MAPLAQPPLATLPPVLSSTTKLIRDPRDPPDGEAAYPLSPCDLLSITTATARACFWRGQRFDADALERCLERVLTDLPFLAGRVAPVRGLKMGDLHIVLSNKGVLLTVAEAPCVRLAGVGPDSWTMQGITLGTPQIPFYLCNMDGGRVVWGREPLMKVRLTRLADGDILGITLSHCLTDGMRWSGFLTHFAARYREAVTGVPAQPEQLLRPSSRADLTAAKLAARLGMSEAAAAAAVASAAPPGLAWPSLADYWRTGSKVVWDAVTKRDLLILHVPRERMRALKAQAAAATGNSSITTGDAAQALAGMLVNAATGGPLLPLPPRYQVVLVQLQGVDPQLFGNSVHLLPVQAPKGEPPVPEGDYPAAFNRLASLIRTTTADFRAQPETSVAALAQLEALVAAPAHRMLAFLAGRRLPLVTCSTNYIGALQADEDVDFGFGRGPDSVRWLVTPLGSDMAVIRPAMPPYGEGHFVMLSATPAQAKRLREHPVLPALLGGSPTFVGE